MALDTRKEKAKKILRELVKISDVFIQNFRPGVIAKMGFSYEALYDLNPRIIMLNVSAYGQYGPYKDRVGFDTIGQAISGFMSVTGYPGNPPTRAGASIIDRVTALNGTIAEYWPPSGNANSREKGRPSMSVWPTPDTASRK